MEESVVDIISVADDAHKEQERENEESDVNVKVVVPGEEVTRVGGFMMGYGTYGSNHTDQEVVFVFGRISFFSLFLIFHNE